MAKFMTEIYTTQAKQHQLLEFNDTDNNQKKRINKLIVGKRKIKINHSNKTINSVTDLAPRFKYKTNFPLEDIEKFRELLSVEREKQNEDEFEFWTPDFNRMLKDDWLVTRFLLRGLKASQKYADFQNLKHLNNNEKEEEEEEEEEELDNKKKLIFDCTMQLVRSCAKFRLDYKINSNTNTNEFPIEWLKVNGLFNYKPDFAGNPTIYLRICLHKPKLIETKESRHEFKRLLLYNLEKCDQDLNNNMGKGVCCIFDMSNATFENIDLELASWMIKSFKSCSPKLLAYVIVYNLPWFFSATFKLLTTTLMSNSNKQCLRFVYGNEILQYIDYNNLPSYLKDSIKYN